MEQMEILGLESQRSKYTSIRASAIVLRLFYRVDKERMDFCVKNNLLTPERMRQKKLEKWIDRRRRKKEKLLKLTKRDLPLAL
jgi:hypothetical protein